MGELGEILLLMISIELWKPITLYPSFLKFTTFPATSISDNQLSSIKTIT